ncbi:hypothetical protein [Variovorax sp. dw_954]|uniref:hypothetical protein n=1 Tax=Variovorax sp. dw_954 TaxID=2720078 RepID=UPI002116809A|nr:hypothetical protein [Variovorax sp. dw_954]
MTTDAALIDPNNAVDFLIAVAGKFAAAKSERVYLEEFRKTKKALLMNLSPERSAVAREQYAYSHPEYQQLLEGLRAAVEAEETLKFKIIAAQLRVEVWRSQNANNRGQDRVMR